MNVVTRFAPSPTGYLHIGGIRTALFSWLYARHQQGRFLLRIEDTDRQRSTAEAIDVILQGLDWLGLDADREPVYQSQRADVYREVIGQLLEKDHAYHCFCSRDELDAMREDAMRRGAKPRYDGRCRDRTERPAGIEPVVRFKNPQQGEVVIEDLIQGRVVYDNTELDDLIIARADGTPTYNLCVVVDDMDMGITHVIRGDDHLNNTPRQMNIFAALEGTPPAYGHIPLILGPDGKKLSKRHGTVSVLEYRQMGYLPQALLNYLVRLGWSHGDQELFSRQEMIELFDIARVNKSAAAINQQKLDWINQHYLQQAGVDDLLGPVTALFGEAGIDTGTGPELRTLITVQKERVKTLRELVDQSRFFYEDFARHDEQAAKKHLRPVILQPLETLQQQLAKLDDWTAGSIKQCIDSTAEAIGLKLGKLAQPLRVAVTGAGVSPSIDITLELLGRDRTQSRITLALEYIRARAEA